ncbi:hypothetical protein J1614_001207 [Plenodomus biglobosus]|nr:hypothetical protein J1614_001207 [Plenodomus biglobosus]
MDAVSGGSLPIPTPWLCEALTMMAAVLALKGTDNAGSPTKPYRWATYRSSSWELARIAMLQWDNSPA